MGTMDISIDLTGGQSAKRAFGDVWTAYIVKSGLQYTPRAFICHIKDVTALLCHSLVNYSRINLHADSPIGSFPYAGKKILLFAYYCQLFNSYIIYENITYDKWYQKSRNNTLASPFCEIGCNLGKIAHFIVEPTASIIRWPNLTSQNLSIFHP